MAIAQKTKIVICPKCRRTIYVIKGQEEPTHCPRCGAELEVEK